jgi:hypothetical protein
MSHRKAFSTAYDDIMETTGVEAERTFETVFVLQAADVPPLKY